MQKTIPEDYIVKWQNIADLIADIFYVPAALIMKTENEYMEVFISSNSKNNPYKVGDTEHWSGLYCENVIKTQEGLLVPNALADEDWSSNPDIKLGMIAYLGYPINYPNGSPFGTICVLDYKENPFNEGYQQLLMHFRDIIEFDLKTIDTFGSKTEELNQTIFDQHNNLKAINNELLVTSKLLQDSESRYKQLSDLSWEGVIIHKNGIALEVNLAFLKIFGFEENEIIGQNVISMIALEPFQELIHENVKNEVLTPYQILAKRKDGSIIPLEIEGKTVGVEGKDKIRVAAIRDISHRKTAEQALNKMSAAVKQSANSIVITDKQGLIEYVNPKFTELLGYNLEEIVGKDPLEIFEHLHTEDYYNDIKKTLTSGDSWNGEMQNKSKDGRLFWEKVTISPIRNDQGDITNFVTIKEDISAMKQAEEELIKKNNELIEEKEKAKESLEQFQQLFENMEQGFALHEMLYDKQGKPIDYRFILINKAFEKLTGISSNKYIGKTIKEVIPDIEDKWIKRYGEVASTGTLVNFEEYSIAFEKHYNVVAYSPKKDLFAVIFTDVTDVKNYQKDLIIAKEKAEESDQLKTEFFNNMSHEIRTPLNGIMGFTSILDDPGLSAEDRKSYVDIVLGCGEQLLRIVDDILEVSMLETKQSTMDHDDVCLNNLLLDLYSEYYKKATNKNLTLEIDLGLNDDSSCIVTDEIKLTKIIRNLLDNALKFTDEGVIKFGYTVVKQEIIIHVIDTGIGINPKNHGSIFDRFSQEEKSLSQKVGGLGLGLSIVKENVSLLNGEITLHSEKGKGASFNISLPYIPAASKQIEKAPVSTDGIIRTVLVAEDEEISCYYIDTLLKSLGYCSQIIHAKNGQEAVDLCTENNDIDIVLMDIKMPVLNGYEATTIIKKKRPNLPIIAQTAYSTEKDIEAAMKVGFDDFIAKPISKNRFQKVVEKYFVKK